MFTTPLIGGIRNLKVKTGHLTGNFNCDGSLTCGCTVWMFCKVECLPIAFPEVMYNLYLDILIFVFCFLKEIFN